jgi:D-tyrosyl-tRNA(Tyr) deacylase
MRAIIQRVTSASVSVGGQLISSIGPGLCVLVGISRGDVEKDAEYICRKVLNMKLWDDPKSGKPWQQSVVRLLCPSHTVVGRTAHRAVPRVLAGRSRCWCVGGATVQRPCLRR